VTARQQTQGNIHFDGFIGVVREWRLVAFRKTLQLQVDFKASGYFGADLPDGCGNGMP
jgi:hypothetical protein